MKNQNLFVIFCLVLTLGLIQSYSVFRDYFSDSKDLRQQLSSLREENERERLRVSMLQNQILDFQIDVAAVLPQSTYAQKKLAQKIRMPASDKQIDFSDVMMQKGKSAFADKKYSEAIAIFKELRITYPTSSKTIEAQFLTAEAYFLMAKYPQALSEIEEMMTHYPADDLTGFIMIRMGQIASIRNRNDEAIEILKLVGKNFSHNKAIKDQAESLIKSIESL